MFHTSKTAKMKTVGDITVHHSDITAMCCRIILPSFYRFCCVIFACIIDLTRRC